MHSPSPVDVILATNLITLLHALPTLQPHPIGIRSRLATPSPSALADIASEGGVARRAGGGNAEVDASAGVVLGASVGGEDLDGVVDAGDGEEGFVRMTWWCKSVVCSTSMAAGNKKAVRKGMITLDDIDDLPISL